MEEGLKGETLAICPAQTLFNFALVMCTRFATST
jgi:hypothetical protein